MPLVIMMMGLGTLRLPGQNVQTTGEVSTVALSDAGPYSVTNNSTTYTAQVTIVTNWEAEKTDPKTGQKSTLILESRSSAVRISPSGKTTVSVFRPSAKEGYFPKRINNWHHLVEWPNKAAEDEALRQKKETEEMLKRIEEERKKGSSPAETSAFSTFLANLKRSGKTSGYYPGDAHFDSGYYSDTGQFLGKEDPERAAIIAGTNPGFDKFGKPLTLNNFGTPLSLSNFDNRDGKKDPVVPTYIGGIPSAPTFSPAPAWAWDGRPETWTDSMGNVYLAEPLPPELQNLTPAQLGVRPDTYSSTDYRSSMERSVDNFLKKNGGNSAAYSDDILDQAWKDSGVNFADEEFIDDLEGDDPSLDSLEEKYTAIFQAQESGLPKLIREVKEREAAEIARANNEGLYRNEGEGYEFFKRAYEAEADLIQKEAKELGFTVPSREEALKQGYARFGATYVSKAEMIRWNQHVKNFGLEYDENGLPNKKLLYKIEDENRDAPAPNPPQKNSPAKDALETSPKPAPSNSPL